MVKEMSKSIIGTKIIQERKRFGISQYQLAQLLNIKQPSVSQWESGESVPYIKHIKVLSKIFRKPMEYFADDTIPIDPLLSEDLFNPTKEVDVMSIDDDLKNDSNDFSDPNEVELEIYLSNKTLKIKINEYFKDYNKTKEEIKRDFFIVKLRKPIGHLANTNDLVIVERKNKCEGSECVVFTTLGEFFFINTIDANAKVIGVLKYILS